MSPSMLTVSEKLAYNMAITFDSTSLTCSVSTALSLNTFICWSRGFVSGFCIVCRKIAIWVRKVHLNTASLSCRESSENLDRCFGYLSWIWWVSECNKGCELNRSRKVFSMPRTESKFDDF